MATLAARGNDPADLAGMCEEDRAAWRRLAEHRAESAPFIDEEWIGACIESFRPAASLLLTQRRDGRLVGLAPLQRLTESWAGRRIAVLQSLTTHESYRFDFLALPGRSDVEEGLWRPLCNSRRWDVIRLDHLSLSLIPPGGVTRHTA